MNATTMTDDEVVELLARTMRAVATAAPEMPLDDGRHRSRWPTTCAAAALVVVGIVGLGMLGGRSPAPTGAGVPVPVTTSDLPTATDVPTADTAPPGTSPEGTTPPTSSAVAGEWAWPAAMPAGVPQPADPWRVDPIMWDREQVGWELSDRGAPTDSVQRCTDYAEGFGPSWTSTPDTDEGPSVLYARHFGTDQWDVGVYCTSNGDFLVQVIEARALGAVPHGVPGARTDPVPTSATADAPMDTEPGVAGTTPLFGG